MKIITIEFAIDTESTPLLLPKHNVRGFLLDFIKVLSRFVLFVRSLNDTGMFVVFALSQFFQHEKLRNRQLSIQSKWKVMRTDSGLFTKTFVTPI